MAGLIFLALSRKDFTTRLLLLETRTSMKSILRILRFIFYLNIEREEQTKEAKDRLPFKEVQVV